MSAEIYRLDEMQLNILAREIRELGVNPPMKAITTRISKAYALGYAAHQDKTRRDKVTPEEAHPFRRTYEPQHRQFDLKPGGET